MKLYLLVWGYHDGCFYVVLLNKFPSLPTFYSPQKRFYPTHKLCNGSHNEHKILYEIVIRLSPAIKDLYLLWITWYKHVNYGLNLFRIQYFTFFRHYEPIIIPKNTMETHFSRSKLIPNFLHFQSTISI
jgi:hypothetical protein